MKSLTLFMCIFFTATGAYPQQSQSDSLMILLSKTKEDTTRVLLLSQLCWNEVFSNPDSGLLFGQKGLKLAQSIGYKKGEFDCKANLAVNWWAVGDYATTIKLMLEVIDFRKAKNDTSALIDLYGILAHVQRDQGDYNEALKCVKNSDQLAQNFNNCSECGGNYATKGSIYYEMNKLDSALVNLKKGGGGSNAWILLRIGMTYAKMNNNNIALDYYRQSIKALSEINNLKDLAAAYNSVAELFKKTGATDSVIYYSKQALNIAQQKKFNKEILQSCLLLSNAYKTIDTKKAFDYLSLAVETKDSLYSREKQRQILSYKFNEELRQQQIRNAEEQNRNRIRIYVLITALALLIVIGLILYHNSQHRERAKAKIEQAYNELKTTQSQLIQSEKMASLGELTAGIAHEIQNPLNFVNNFSEVNKELLVEMKEEMKKGNIDDADSIANDVINNEEKINHHGKRADAIVKGMLQHSRGSNGVKEPTDINALADEYLRMSYHGVRAKDNSFNATMKTDYDETIGNINIIPQDIGRVILNLITNAFYAVTEKKKQQPDNYGPIVTVSTRKLSSPLGDGGKIEIRVGDNGNGIPQKVLDKIFQPFFTTKPTGQGTGLGLSLSYDIIKAHGGEIKVETKEREGSDFIIKLPIA